MAVILIKAAEAAGLWVSRPPRLLKPAEFPNSWRLILPARNAGVDVNARTGELGMTLLHSMAQAGRADAVHALLVCGADAKIAKANKQIRAR